VIPLAIHLEGDGAFEKLRGRDDWQGGFATDVAVLAGGTTSGKPSIAFLVEGEDGALIVAQTTWALLHAACRAIEARYGRPA